MPHNKDIKSKSAAKMKADRKFERTQRTKKRIIRFAIIGALILVTVLAGIILTMNVLIPAYRYSVAMDLINQGRLSEACAIFVQLNHYKDSDASLEQYSRQIMTGATVGDIVYWGRYEQDNKITNDKEIIQWRVLDKKQNRLLLLSEKSLDEKPYNMKAVAVTWETCTLREWLNNTFINAAFSTDEKSAIVRTELVNEANAEFNTNGGNNTFDNAFLLCLSEIEVYLPEEKSRIGRETAYAIVQYGKFVVDFPTWWLRTPGKDLQCALSISETGYIITDGSLVSFAEPIRPALWIDLSSDLFAQ